MSIFYGYRTLQLQLNAVTTETILAPDYLLKERDSVKPDINAA